MEDDGWIEDEREDVLALGKPPVAPTNVKRVVTNIREDHPGETKAGHRRRNAIRKEHEDLRKEFEKMTVSKGEVQDAKQEKCLPCCNRSRACDYKRPQCGTCIEKGLAKKCRYRQTSTEDPDTKPPSSPGGEAVKALESPGVVEVAASASAVSNHASDPSDNPRLETDTSNTHGGPEAIAEELQPKRRDLKRGRERGETVFSDEDRAEEREDKRIRLRSPYRH